MAVRIDRIQCVPVRLPFTGEFSHAQRRSANGDNVVILLWDGNHRQIGAGEGAPRRADSGGPAQWLQVMDTIMENRAFPWDLSHVAQIQAFIAALPDSAAGNPVGCAVETALLDALARHQNNPLTALLPTGNATDIIRYGATLSLADPDRTETLCRAFAATGIRSVRVKADPDRTSNTARLNTVRSLLGSKCRIRVDANCSWTLGDAMDHIPLLQTHGVAILEEPLALGDPDLVPLSKRLRTLHIDLMACQSTTTQAAVTAIASNGIYTMANIKLSRSGGFFRSLAVIDCLRRHHIPFQIGCEPGESGILSAAGRALSLCCADAVDHDGSYDEWLLAQNLTTDHVGFGAGGRAGPLPGPGLGVTLNDQALDRLRITQDEIRRPQNQTEWRHPCNRS